MMPRHQKRGVLPMAALLIVLSGALTACLGVKPDTSKIVKVSSVTSNGYVWDYYRNLAYPCSISGYQTFVIGTKVGSSSTATKPLWVFLHGGGTGTFSSDGKPLPNGNNMDEESRSSLINYLTTPGLNAKVRSAGYRIMGVSMCSHDIYGGMNTTDPYNPNTTPGGKPRPTTGLISVMSAVVFARSTYPTDDEFLHGTSAGSVGVFNVAWGLQQQGIAPTGVVADASVLNQDASLAAHDQGVCSSASDYALKTGLLHRIDADIADPDNQPHLLVARGDLDVPILHLWNRGDTNSCGDTPMQCPVAGSVVTLGVTTCQHRPLTLAIDALGPSGRSKNLPVCVEGPDTTTACDKHVVTLTAGTSTLAGGPADYNQAIWNWVQQRRADD